MKFRNLSRAVLLLAGAVGMSFGFTSCSNDHTVGYVYVLGTQYGQVGAYQEDNNNGVLSPVKTGSVVASGGTNPVRAVIPAGSRFVYVLNAGTPTPDATAGSPTSGAVVGYSSSNISLFSIGGYGQLSPQLQYPSQGYGSIRVAVDSSGAHLYVLDQYSPVGITAGGTTSPTASNTLSANYPCLGPDGFYHPVGDVAVYAIDGATGRLQVQVNQRQQNLTYFPVGCFPVDFRVTGSYIYTMDAGAPTNAFHTGDVQTVNVQALSTTTGQLTPTQTGAIPVTSPTNGPVNISAVNGDLGGAHIYLLDTQNDFVYAYSVGTNGALTPVTSSPFRSEPSANGVNPGLGPIQSVVDSTGKYIYLADNSNIVGNAEPNVPESDIAAYNINATTGDLLVPVQTSGYGLGTVANPSCIFEDPTNQFLYVAGAADNSITGRIIDPNTGTLKDLNKGVAFPVVGTPSWCLEISSTL